MENILFPVDDTEANLNTIDFACYIANITHSRLNAVFIGNIKENEVPVQKLLFALPYVETIVSADIPGNKKMLKTFEENEKIFSEACINRGVTFHSDCNFKISVSDMIGRSRFSDLMILGRETSIESGNQGSPSPFVKEMLASAECPVMIAPYSFEDIAEIIFAYDGSKSSVFAIKQFTYIFPELNTKIITLLQVGKSDARVSNDTNRVESLLKSHYTNIKFEYLRGNPGDELFGYLLGKKNTMVVMGAFGRNFISNTLKKSTADLVLKTIDLPFFITHCT